MRIYSSNMELSKVEREVWKLRNSIEIAKDLKAIRKMKGITIKQAIKDLNISINTLLSYERDAKNITYEMLMKMINYYDVDAYIFFSQGLEYILKRKEG